MKKENNNNKYNNNRARLTGFIHKFSIEIYYKRKIKHKMKQ